MSAASSNGQYRRKETFVEDMLYHIADSLASDAEFGYNNANQIRDRVEDIAVDMNSNISSSRAVLESRFALGKDNCQYLAQAVAVLWAGDGGERLRVLPPGQMPSILRQASADGVVRAMRGVMGEQMEHSRRAVVDAIALVAWMMQSETIRAAVLEYVELSDLKEEAEKIQAEYDKGDNNGMDHLIKLAKSAYEQEKSEGEGDHATVQSLLEAVYALTDPSSAPQMILGDMLNESQNMVNRTARDSHLVAELQSVMGQMSALTALSGPESKSDEAAEAEGSSNHCERKFDAWGRVTKRMDNGTAVTRNQFTVATHAAFNSMRGNNIGNEKINDGWNVERVISPFWNQGSLRDTSAKQTAWDQIIGDETNSRDSTLSEEMRRAIRDVYTLGIKSLGGTLLERRQFLQDNLRDTLYIDYCMIRGNCGFKGPHQTSRDQDVALPYQYPQRPMIGYTEGKYCDAHMDVLANDTHLQIRGMMHKHYVEPEERHKVRCDTDPYPRVLNEIDSSNGDGSESARKVAWAPVPGQNDEISFDPESSNLCEASMYEFMLRALELQAKEVENDNEDMFRQRRVRCLRAVAASIKIRQLMPMANLKQYNDINDTTAAQKENRVYVTRAARHCVPAGSKARPYEMQRVSMPYDSGIALFEGGTPGTKPVTETLPEDTVEMVKVLGSDYTPDRKEEFQQDGSFPIAPYPNPNSYNTYDVNKSAKDVTRWLRQGVESGWKNEDGETTSTIGVAPANFSLFAQPSRGPRETGYDDTLTPNKRFSTDFDKEMVPDDLYDGNIHNAVVRGMNAIGLLRQIDKEHKYIQKLSAEDSAERVGVFGVHGEKTLEGATRERRDGVWNDALREINVSGDRLYRFITILTGAIGESADSAISWEDEDLKQVSKEALARQKTLSERVSRFQTKLVESVVSSTLKSSKLQLDMRKSNTNSQELVVLSADTRENIRQIADGEAGHGFFEAQVEFNDALGKYAKPMSIKDIVSDLQSVSKAFYDQIAASLAPSSGASYARIVEPRNSFMLHLKPDTMAAIQKAYDHISSEMRHCGGYHREIHLWEFVEGKDWTLVTRFAELVGLMLQNTRMRSGSFAAYVGMSQQIANGNNIRMQLQRLRAQACIYLVAQPDAPMWLHKNGRTWYFGGSTSGPNSNGGMRAERAKKRRCRNESQSYDDYGACIGRQKRRLNRPSRDQNMRAYRTNMKDSWKQDDDGKPSGATQNGIEKLGSSAAQSALDITKEDVSNRLKSVVALMGMAEFARCFYQMVIRYTSNSPGFECETVYGEKKKAIQKLLCEALDKDNGKYASPKNGSSTERNPYIRCTNAENSQQPCLPAAVGDYLNLPGDSSRYHAVKVDVFPALNGGDVLDLVDVNDVTIAFNEVFAISNETVLCDDTGEVGWFPHPQWMEKVQTESEGGVPVRWERIRMTEANAITAPLFQNVWLKKVQKTDAMQHTAGTIVRNLLNMVETLTEFKKTAVAAIVTTAVATTFPNFFSNMTNAIASTTTLMVGLTCLRLQTALAYLQRLLKNDAALNHDGIRENLNTLHNLQANTSDQDAQRMAHFAALRKWVDTIATLMDNLTKQTARAGYNSSAIGSRSLAYPNSNSRQSGMSLNLRTPVHVATCLLAFGPMAFTPPQATAPQLGTEDSRSLIDTAIVRIAHAHGYAYPETDEVMRAVTDACKEQARNGVFFSVADSEAMAEFTQRQFPLQQGALIAGLPAAEVAAMALARQSVAINDDAIKLHTNNRLMLGGIGPDFSIPAEAIEILKEKLDSLPFIKKNEEERAKLLEQSQYYKDFLEKLRFRLSSEPTYAMAAYDMINGLYLGSFTTALFAWGDESNEGRQILMAVVRALQEATMNIKGAVLGVYDSTGSATAFDDLFSNNMRESSEFKKITEVLSKLTGMEEDEIAQDEAFISEIKDIFADRFGTSGFSKFMEVILERRTRTVFDCQESGDGACKQRLRADMDALMFRLQRDNLLPKQPSPSPLPLDELS